MITIRLTNYTEKEKEALTLMFDKLHSLCGSACYGLGVPCEECKIKSLCYDLYKASQFLKEQSKRG